MRIPPVLIHFRLGVSLIKIIQLIIGGTPMTSWNPPSSALASMMVVKIHPFKRGPALTSSPGTQGRPKGDPRWPKMTQSPSLAVCMPRLRLWKPRPQVTLHSVQAWRRWLRNSYPHSWMDGGDDDWGMVAIGIGTRKILLNWMMTGGTEI